MFYIHACIRFRFVVDMHGCVQCAGKHVARNRGDSWVAFCAESDAAESCTIAAKSGCGPEGLYRLCHFWSVLILLFLHADHPKLLCIECLIAPSFLFFAC